MPKQLIGQDITLEAGSGAITVDTTVITEVYNLITASDDGITLSGDLSIDPTGTAAENMLFRFNFQGGVALNGHTFNIFGNPINITQALAPFIIEFQYISGAWTMNLFYSIAIADFATILGNSIIHGTIPNVALTDATITLAKLAVAEAQGDLISSGSGGAYQTLAAKTTGNIVAGNGTDVVSVAMSGDATIDGSGVVTISDDAITGAKIASTTITSDNLAVTLLTDCKIVSTSFESGELGAYTFKMPFAGTITDIYAVAVKAIAATDAATIVLKNNAGTTMTVTTPISFPASSALATSQDSAVTANNTFVAGDIITLLTAKATAGGKALVTLTIIRA